ncbi:hypothetical protein DL239_16985 [Sedimentitalea sp. CY04]|uniref:Phospholipase A2 n=1 Tax=Parasedimentitalea denitrificans TaxID=2211118 RepID=A0ABX0WAJ7_9RHOB|nr:hypothetical protein [Sedimentitalea sp. CY04]NIZ62669.1 hypothetical protein [Sedimentitalea sp. CY04]
MSAHNYIHVFAAIGTLAALWSGSALAQNWDQLGRGLELKAHQALMKQVKKVSSPQPFTTDGCSGGMSSAWQGVAAYWPQFARDHQQQPPFESCCISHDRTYHDAGSALTATDSYEARLSADRTLQSCVIETGQARRDDLAERYGVSTSQVTEAYQLLAGSMYYSVRFGGGPCSGLSWRWGYGYDQCWSGN